MVIALYGKIKWSKINCKLNNENTQDVPGSIIEEYLNMSFINEIYNLTKNKAIKWKSKQKNIVELIWNFRVSYSNFSLTWIDKLSLYLQYKKPKPTYWLTDQEIWGTAERIAMKLGTQLPIRS